MMLKIHDGKITKQENDGEYTMPVGYSFVRAGTGHLDAISSDGSEITFIFDNFTGIIQDATKQHRYYFIDGNRLNSQEYEKMINMKAFW